MTQESLDDVLAAADAAARQLERYGPDARAALLEVAADALERRGDELVAVAREETHLTEPRLRGELVRTLFQARLFAREVRSGALDDVIIDHADPSWPMGPRPELRRCLVPLGTVLVFAASNFPFAFSVFGGDTTSALAAGCSVVVKAHSYHPRLSRLTAEIVAAALDDAGAPRGTFALIEGREAGVAAITDERVDAAAFTGSFEVGRLLFDLASGRPRPIPFFGELSSVNPVFVTRAAARLRAAEIAQGFVASLTTSAGQLCTKPGVVLVPAESDLVARVTDLVAGADGAPLLHANIARSFRDAVQAVSEDARVHVVGDAPAREDAVRPLLMITTADAVRDSFVTLTRECFGPAALLVAYDDEVDLNAVAELFTGELTASVHGEADEPQVVELARILARRAGRVLWNQWPTGVSVTYAQQHGGPYPATTAPATTSVGMTAARRFQRPVAFQGWPEALLPSVLRDGTASAARRIDGEFAGIERI